MNHRVLWNCCLLISLSFHFPRHLSGIDINNFLENDYVSKDRSSSYSSIDSIGKYKSTLVVHLFFHPYSFLNWKNEYKFRISLRSKSKTLIEINSEGSKRWWREYRKKDEDLGDDFALNHRCIERGHRVEVCVGVYRYHCRTFVPPISKKPGLNSKGPKNA